MWRARRGTRFYRTIGRPDLIERFSRIMYFEEEKAELWPILDEVFPTKTTAEWSALLRCRRPALRPGA